MAQNLMLWVSWTLHKCYKSMRDFFLFCMFSHISLKKMLNSMMPKCSNPVCEQIPTFIHHFMLVVPSFPVLLLKYHFFFILTCISLVTSVLAFSHVSLLELILSFEWPILLSYIYIHFVTEMKGKWAYFGCPESLGSLGVYVMMSTYPAGWRQKQHTVANTSVIFFPKITWAMSFVEI